MPLCSNTTPITSNIIIDMIIYLINVQDGVRMSYLCKDGELMEYLFEDTRTLYDVFQRGKRISGNYCQ